jgi:hypothetical protein
MACSWRLRKSAKRLRVTVVRNWSSGRMPDAILLGPAERRKPESRIGVALFSTDD